MNKLLYLSCVIAFAGLRAADDGFTEFTFKPTALKTSTTGTDNAKTDNAKFAILGQRKPKITPPPAPPVRKNSASVATTSITTQPTLPNMVTSTAASLEPKMLAQRRHSGSGAVPNEDESAPIQPKLTVVLPSSPMTTTSAMIPANNFMLPSVTSTTATSATHAEVSLNVRKAALFAAEALIARDEKNGINDPRVRQHCALERMRIAADEYLTAYPNPSVAEKPSIDLLLAYLKGIAHTLADKSNEELHPAVARRMKDDISGMQAKYKQALKNPLITPDQAAAVSKYANEIYNLSAGKKDRKSIASAIDKSTLKTFEADVQKRRSFDKEHRADRIKALRAIANNSTDNVAAAHNQRIAFQKATTRAEIEALSKTAGTAAMGIESLTQQLEEISSTLAKPCDKKQLQKIKETVAGMAISYKQVLSDPRVKLTELDIVSQRSQEIWKLASGITTGNDASAWQAVASAIDDSGFRTANTPKSVQKKPVTFEDLQKEKKQLSAVDMMLKSMRAELEQANGSAGAYQPTIVVTPPSTQPTTQPMIATTATSTAEAARSSTPELNVAELTKRAEAAQRAIGAMAATSNVSTASTLQSIINGNIPATATTATSATAETEHYYN